MAHESMHRLQSNLDDILAGNVVRLEAVQDLEIQVRQLRFHTFLYLLDPGRERFLRIEADERNFEAAFARVRQVAVGDDETRLLDTIDHTYRQYRKEQDLLIAEADGRPLPEVYKIADRHPVRLVVTPCQQLLKINNEKLAESADRSRQVTGEAYLAMLFLGIAGPIAGLVLGYGFTRGLRRSIARLSIRVQDLAQHLDYDVGSVSIAGDRGLDQLEADLQGIVQKVQDVARQIQEQQRAMIHAQQLSQAGQLAAAVAHEIRNPVTGIKLLAEAALRDASPRPFDLEDTRFVLREANRLEQTVQHFLDFARLPSVQRTTCDLRDIVRRAWEMVHVRAVQQGVQANLSLPREPVAVSADAGQLTAVLVNVFFNALDAIGSTGHIDIELVDVSDAVELRIRDTGPGIAAEIHERLFQPFATSKPNGTGLGLFLASRVLDDHGGSIRAANLSPGGACFTIRLPRRRRRLLLLKCRRVIGPLSPRLCGGSGPG